MAKEYRYIGKSTKRLAATEIVTGRAKYIRDMKMPNMLYGKVLRSPHAHALIKSIDAKKAERLPGVKAVLTYKNCPDWKWGLLGIFPENYPHSLLLDRQVRYVGDNVALVAAETEEIAEAALGLIEVEYELLPAVFKIEEAIKPGAPQLHDLFPGNLCPKIDSHQQCLDLIMGDVEKGFTEAEVTAEVDFTVGNWQNPLTAEAPGAIAEWKEDECTLWGTLGAVGLIELKLRSCMKMPPGKLRVIASYCGGNFGSKNDPRGPYIHAPALAKAAGRPVACFLSREEQFSHLVRLGTKGHCRVGMKKDGTVTALQGELLFDAGACISLQHIMIAVGLEAVPALAKVSNADVRTKLILTNNIPSGPFRGFGYMECTQIFSSVLQAAMEKAELDPLEYFKKNCIEEGDQFPHTYMGLSMQTAGCPGPLSAIEKAAKLFRWKDRWQGWGKPTTVEGARRRGIGIGVAAQTDIGEQNSDANVALNAEGVVTVYTSLAEFGTGARDVVRKIAAEALQVSLENVQIAPPDSAIGPWEWGSTGSRSTYAIGTAVLRAAEDAKEKLFQLAARILEARPEDLATTDGMVHVKGEEGGKRLTWSAVIGGEDGVAGSGHFPARYNMPAYQIQFVEVEVDTGTGQVHVIDLLSATEIGQIVDPLMLQGQLQGFHPGIDLALREESVVDRHTGRLLSGNMIDYKTRTFQELPNHRFVVTETPAKKADPAFPFGAKGGAEVSLAPGGPAVCMAIYNAIGQRFLEYPITPDKILKALGKVKGGSAR